MLISLNEVLVAQIKYNDGVTVPDIETNVAGTRGVVATYFHYL